jgi:hypothetical protein
MIILTKTKNALNSKINKNVSLIDFGPVKSIFKISPQEKSEGYVLKKILLSGKSGVNQYNNHYPEAEIVQDLQAITGDHSIDLVMITGALHSQAGLFSEILKAGKNIRIVDQLSD